MSQHFKTAYLIWILRLSVCGFKSNRLLLKEVLSICMTQKPTHNTTLSTPPTPNSYLDNLLQTVNNLNILFHKWATKTGYLDFFHFCVMRHWNFDSKRILGICCLSLRVRFVFCLLSLYDKHDKHLTYMTSLHMPSGHMRAQRWVCTT